MKQSLFYKIVGFIYEHNFEKRGWKEILLYIKNLFESDIAFFGIYEDEKNLVYHSSDDDVEGWPVEVSSVAMKSILEKKIFAVSNYPSFEFSNREWVEKGVKSVLSVPVYFGDKKFGVLQIAYTSRYKRFTKNQIDLLDSISKILSLALSNSSHSTMSEIILSLMIKEFEFFYSRSIPNFFSKAELKEWIVSYLRNMLDISDAKAVGFVFPSENIYVSVIKEDDGLKVKFSSEVDEEIKDFILFKIYKKSISKVLSFDDLESYGIERSDLSKKLNIKSALFVPIKYEDRIIVTAGFGFDRKVNIDREYRLALQNSAAHLVFMLMASKNVSILNNELIDTHRSFLESFILMMEARDTYTKGHSQRVALYAKKIAEVLGYDGAKQEKIYTAGLLHDIGKIGIPDNILLKPGKLTPNEYRIIKNHAEFSYAIIKNIRQFKDISDCVRYHHERCDGSGYPKGLKCDEIPECAKILAISDILDAITTSRPYREKLTFERAVEIMRKYMAKEIDENIFLRSVGVLKEVYENVFKKKNLLSSVSTEIDEIRKKIFTTDYMTGLLRRREFVDGVSRFMKENLYTRFIMVYFDIKNLSYINYNYSMDVGDKIIIYTAEALKKRDEIKFLARTEPDAFYFIVIDKSKPAVYLSNLKSFVKQFVVEKLTQEEFLMEGWKRIVDYFVSYSEYLPGKDVENMMYECKNRKKEFEELLL